jgi:cell volume regulation protein A
LLDRIYGASSAVSDEELLGDFVLPPGAVLAEVARLYGLQLGDGATATTAAEFLMRELNGPPEVGDRASLGPVDLVVRAVDGDGAISEVGLALEPQTSRPDGLWRRLDLLLRAARLRRSA